MLLKHLSEMYIAHKEKSLFGRYITNTNIESLIESLNDIFEKERIGFSVEKRPIYSVKIGTGKIKILVWSQMHGNESTTTKALFDVFNVIDNSNELNDLLKLCTLYIIPILNPDGAEHYTRNNANNIDLNRDAQDLSQPESVVLRNAFNIFEPDYCLNLHGQRTIFGAGSAGNIATLSFLSPAEDEDRTVTKSRKKGMAVIAAINKEIQHDLPNYIGRYDDGFNKNCVGDTFQSLKVPTILYEAGHFENDYSREVVREYVFKSLILGLKVISGQLAPHSYEAYFDIPENVKNFYDVIIRNVKLEPKKDEYVDVAIQFKEVLVGKSIKFVPYVEQIGHLNEFYAHNTIEGGGMLIKTGKNETPKVGYEIVFVMLNNDKILIKS